MDSESIFKIFKDSFSKKYLDFYKIGIFSRNSLKLSLIFAL